MIEVSAPTARLQRGALPGSAAVALFAAFLATVVIRTAWVADGAFVDLRTVANVAAGHGLRWNVDERVQAFTDPLWVVLVSAVNLLVQQPYIAVLLISIVLTLAAVWLLTARVAVNPFAALVAVAFLTFSRSFIEYATGGFQTPLVYLLMVMFWATSLERDANCTTRLLLIASLCALKDWTAVLALVPALIATLASTRPRVQNVLAGVSPVIAWMLFAAWYYGAVIPSPIVAAWHGLGPLSAMARQVLAYLLDATDADPLTIAAIALAVVGGFRLRETRTLAIGLALTLAAVVLTGGDVMSGRALAVPALLAAIVAVRSPWDRLGTLFVPAVAAIVALGLVAPESPVLTGPAYHRETEPLTVPWPRMASAISPARAAIRDERRNWYAATGLLTLQRTRSMPDLTGMDREAAERAARQKAVVDDRIGLFAYAAGARLHIIDPNGRTDRVLAQQSPVGGWKPGPRPRDVRPDYVATVERRLSGCSSCDPAVDASPAASPASDGVENSSRNR